MKAQDIMTSHVITVSPDADITTIGKTLVKNSISAVPVVGGDGKLVGIVSEGDLVRRAESGTERRHSWWLDLLTSDQTLAGDFVKSHARKAKDLMTRDVITAEPDTPIGDIANLLEKHHIKRVPIIKNGQLVGILSRANLVQVLASSTPGIGGIDPTDEKLREAIISNLGAQPWGNGLVNVIVQDGVVDLWGFVENETERQALRVAAETTPGVRSVNDNLRIQFFIPRVI
jgi:CBS domain-containing protein